MADPLSIGPASPKAQTEARDLARNAVDRALATGGDQRAAMVDAIRLTERAYAIDHDPLYLCNVGGFYRVLEDWPRAASFLGRCLQLLPATRPEEVARFRGVLDQVERKVAVDHVAILVDVSPAGVIGVSTFGRDELIPAPALVWLPLGTHTITATVPGGGTRTRNIAVTRAMIDRGRRGRVAVDSQAGVTVQVRR